MTFRLAIVLFVCLEWALVQANVFPCNSTLSCGCSRFNVSINARIVGGEDAVDHSWGWAVSLRDSYDNHLCGGSILSRQYVLTAAHCIENMVLTPHWLSIVAGTNLLDGVEGQRIPLSNIFIHPAYRGRTKENDIAVLQLNRSIDFSNANVARICLPQVPVLEQARYPIVQKSLVAIGWGLTTSGGSISNSLRQVTVESTAKKDEKCQNVLNNDNLQFCAAVNGGRKDTCQGDSGGPIMLYSAAEQVWVLTGLTSYGHQCALPDYAGVYTRASVYTDWIRSVATDVDIVTVPQSGTSTPLISTVCLLFVVFSKFV